MENGTSPNFSPKIEPFALVSEFLGYTHKRDITNLDPRYLIPGSQNVLINDGEKVTARSGYSLDGDSNSALTPIEASYDWNSSTNTELNLRAFSDTLQFRYVNSAGTVAWTTLKSGWGDSILFNFSEVWSSTESKDILLFVNGSSNLYEWSGGVTTFASATSNTITKEGTTTWAEDRFLIGGTRKVVIGTTEYAYTGGEGTGTLTGVTPDPTAGGYSAGALVFQAVRTNSSTPSSGVNNDLIRTLNNYVYISDFDKRDVYISKNSSYIDFTFSSPRIPGDGALLTLDSPPVGFAVQENNMYISGSKNEWYQVTFTLSSDLTNESVTVERLKTGPGQGAISQSAIGNIKNSVVYFSNERYIDTLGRVEQINTPQSVPLSDPIKLDLIGYDLTVPPDIKYYKNQTFIAVPSESLILIFDHARGYWQPPQILPVRKLAIISGVLYGHSNAVPETYKIFDTSTSSDNGIAIHAIANFAYRNFGTRTRKKTMTEFYTEGYIKSNTNLTLILKYDYGGFTSIKNYVISGSNDAILFNTVIDNSLGKNPLGSEPLGGISDDVSDLSKFRIINTFGNLDFYELGITYESYDVDFKWEILACGPDAEKSTSDSFEIKQ